jgi:hypothetical protein
VIFEEMQAAPRERLEALPRQLEPNSSTS